MRAEALIRRWAALLLAAVLLTTGCVTLAPPPRGCDAGGPSTCGGVTVPPGWPDFSSGDAEALLAPFLTCASPAEFVALQERVDMPRLVEALDDWRAVRLGALGPVREDAAHLLQRKRAAFLLTTTERHGPFHAQVFALFVLHSAHDDEVDEVLQLLAGDKQLGQTLGLMPAVQEELEQRGHPLSSFPERGEQGEDVLRGLRRAARDALATSPLSDSARFMELSTWRAQLPPSYQQASHEVERALALRHFSPGSVTVGTADAMTFGVPLGFYYLVAGTGHGAYSLSQGHYEQATRELAPAVLLGALYAGGRGMRGARGLGLPEPRLGSLKERGRQLEARLGLEGLRELARDIQASREAGRFVAVGGVDAALALREARGNVARAQAWLSEARPEATGSLRTKNGTKAGATKSPGGMASLLDERAGLTPEVVQARLAAVELEAAGPRLSREMAMREKQRPSLEAPPPGAEGNPRWAEYVAYYEKRLGDLRQGKATKGPLLWAPYELMWGWFTRGLAFERAMVKVLHADAKLPRAARRFLGDFDTPRIESYVGVTKPGTGLRYADVLVVETRELAGSPPRIETFSFKSRDFSRLQVSALEAQLVADAREALRKYGETLDIRRDSLRPLFREGSKVPVSRVRLVYEGGPLMPKMVDGVEAVVSNAQVAAPGVEILFQ